MAFIPATPLSIRTPFTTSSPFTHLHSNHPSQPLRPRHQIRPRPAKLSANTPQDNSEEVSVPLTSLKDLNRPPTPPAPADQQSSAAQGDGNEDGQGKKDLRSEKQKEIDRLRAAEKFITVDEGNFECTACGYVYEPKKGIRQNNIAPDTAFEDLPSTFVCPVCRSPKNRFISKKKVIAGFADNQKYGFGSNTLTGGQKSALIFGGLVFCFLLLLSGYALN